MALYDPPLTLLSRAGQLAEGALALSSGAYFDAASTAGALAPALLIAFLAGVSEMAGQSVILVLNRAPIYRFAASLAYTGGIYLLQALVWGLAVMAVAPLARADVLHAGYAGLFTVIAMSYAPRLFGVFAIAPYFGQGISQFLDAWMMTSVIFGLHAATGVPLAAAGIVGLAGWLAAFLARTLISRLLRAPLRRLRRLVSGSGLDLTPEQLLHRFGHVRTEREEP
ncbi:MAG: hypothetical protein AAGC56_14650 [Pseudomonadota bacterium]